MEHLIESSSSKETSSKLENFVQYLNQVTDTDDPDNTERVKGVKAPAPTAANARFFLNSTNASSMEEVDAEFKELTGGASSLMDIAAGGE